ncbi:VOC family protein [Variovorax paradoxus]|nr:VOC family protein [Variovorax paradoxus]
MSNFIQVTPFMHVAELDRALAFFTDILGFTVGYREGGYAYLHREKVGFRLLELEKGCAVPPGDRRYTSYIDVVDLDRLHAELKPKLDTLPEKDVYGPVDQAYGQRELLVLGPDGNLIAFGQAIKKAA